MSKKASSALYELIQSMSKSEKRYFKVLSSRHTIGAENNYVRIFDFLEKQASYSEEELISHFKGEAFLNKFSITKNRLYESIMKSLDVYHSTSSIKAQIYRILHGAEILYNKSLYDQCRRQLRSAEKLALKHDKFPLLIEINQQYKRLIENQGYTGWKEKDLDAILSQDKKYAKRIEDLSNFWHLKSSLFMLLNRKGRARTIEEFDSFKKILDEMLANADKDQFYFDTAYLYNHIYSAYYFAKNEPKECLEYLINNLELFEAHPNKISATPNTYFSILTNTIYVSNRLGKYRDSLTYLKRLKTFSTDFKIDMNEDLSIKLFSSVNSIELTLLTHKGDFAAATKLAPIIEEGIRLYAHKIANARKAYLNFKLSVSYFGMEDYSSALFWINKILNDSSLDEKEDIMAFAQILNLLIHFEMKHTQLLGYALKNVQRFLKTRNRTYQFETIFLKYINKIARSQNIFEIEEHLEIVQQELIAIKDDPFESAAFEYFDFLSWINAKLKKKPFAEMCKQHYQSLLK